MPYVEAGKGLVHTYMLTIGSAAGIIISLNGEKTDGIAAGDRPGDGR
jgi:hypothetical protein